MNRRQVVKGIALLVALPVKTVMAASSELTKVSAITKALNNAPTNPVVILYGYLKGIISADRIDHKSFEEGIKWCETKIRRSDIPQGTSYDVLLYLCEESDTIVAFNGGQVELIIIEDDIPLHQITPDDLIPFASTQTFVGTDQATIRLYCKMNCLYELGDSVEYTLASGCQSFRGKIISLHDCFSESAVCLLIKLV